jgi:CDP-diacylglycerol--serine O-phosphatidyltransferase
VSAPPERDRHGIPLRAVIPNAVTALALCSGLTAIRFGMSAEWDKAVMFVGLSAVLDGMDGRIARALKGQSRFGAELDSLSDLVAFGVAPALIVYLWVLREWNPYGWIFGLAYAVCMALRLARFNARIDVEDQPHKLAGFLTGVPAPAGAAVMLLPMMIWLASNQHWTWLKDVRVVAPWAAFSAFMIISSIATWSLSSLKLRRNVRFEALVLIVLLGGALFAAPWETLSRVVIVYLALIPFSVARYARVKRQRANAPSPNAEEPASPPEAAPSDRPATRRRSGPNSTSE